MCLGQNNYIILFNIQELSKYIPLTSTLDKLKLIYYQIYLIAS
jgi:hypothetical protein